ncbi:MAG: ECF transporter S component [Ruminococcaceae bacterium]|nr:ECF transporter S component [Oscillospiraceae bacterium]
MSKTLARKQNTQKIVFAAILTALVIVLQYVSMALRFGMFSITLVLVPVVIGAATCGVLTGAWLGFVFGVIVLLTGDAASFLAVDFLGTIVTVLAKGTLCGVAAGLVYKALQGKNKYLAVMAAAVTCPIVNTGVFLLGCLIFFLETIKAWGVAAGFTNVTAYMFIGLAGTNFIIELVTNIILAPVILRVLKFAKK